MLNQGWCYRDPIKPQTAGQTVLAFYTQHYPHSSAAEWQARILTAQILLDQQPTQPDALLQLGQTLTYHRPPWQEPDVPLTYEIVWQDSDILVVNKPAGLPVLPGAGFLQHTLLWQLQQQFPEATPIPIHRLGRGTSGLILLGRNGWIRQQLSQQMRVQSLAVTKGDFSSSQRSFRKTYLAWVTPGDYPEQFVCDQPIGKLGYPGLGYLYAASPTGKPAYSLCQVQQRYPEGSLVEVTILTGRPHQIRIHLAAAGYPLVGDPLYGPGGVPYPNPEPPTNLLPNKLAVPGDCGYWLHAAELSFCHPRTGQTLQLTAPPANLPPIKNA